ncbi:3-hydroxyisobutyrate dehydrogenase-like beta-hydroxyacid dehydrogenase [Saccharothrix carnea]|uniref:3-hydroxyisobutyrate dehydrogenase-like beta-hydroxyacid dehydrogenase n=1 Tax=Saccharothrix carnea TaxID=1280637 RepID=A0A2P8HZN4_SACCR|nr:NAD(P)-binding domain-containing protein [Saccharothrix carnea]PSL51687.1 3-hydroxyisobutyrate dehydrogenase-like beta-hydroxyacid dehydrogenase [Saccharothrix carnea]
MTPVTVLGLGPMGRALATAFAAASHPTTVWNRTPGKGDDLDATVADTAADAIAASPLTIVCVLDHEAVRSVLDADALTGRALVNLTGGSPQQAREMAAWAAGHGIGYLDGVLLNGIVGGPEAALLFSGPYDVYQAHRITLAALGENGTYLGEDPGRAAGFNVSLLDLFWTSMSGVVHAFRLGAAENIAATEFAGYAKVMAGLLPELIDVVAEHVTANHFPGDASTIASAAAILDDVITTVQANGLDDSVLSAVRSAVRQAIDAGHGSAGFTRLAVP